MHIKKYHLPSAAAFFLLFLVSCAGTQKAADKGYVCREHGVHHQTNKEEFCICFGIDPLSVSKYYIFSKEAKLSGDETAAAASLKNAVADEIVDMVVKRLNEAFGVDVLSNWSLEKTDLPVIFRSFKKNTPDGIYIESAAVSLKDNFTPRALIKFLPLEYKMKLLKTDEKSTEEFKLPR